jgi:hypothetical protein
MGVSVVLSYSVDNIAYSQLSQSFAMSYFIALLILSRRCKDIIGGRGEMIIMAFLAISTVAISTKASFDLFATFFWGPFMCFLGVLFCAAFVNTQDVFTKSEGQSEPHNG